MVYLINIHKYIGTNTYNKNRIDNKYNNKMNINNNIKIINKIVKKVRDLNIFKYTVSSRILP
jgi:hypothetical protein